MKKKLLIIMAIALFFIGINVKAGTGDLMSDPVDIVFGNSYTKTWTKSTDHLNHYMKVELSQKGILEMQFSKPFDSDQEYGKLYFTVYDENAEPIYENKSYKAVDSASSNYKLYIGLDKGSYYVTVKPGFTVTSGTIVTNYTYNFTPTEFTEVEPNETAKKATELKINNFYTAYYSPDGGNYGDNDYFKFNLVAGEKYRFYDDEIDEYGSVITKFSTPSEGEVYMSSYNGYEERYDSDGNHYYEFTAKETGTFYFRVYNCFGHPQKKYMIGIFSMSVNYAKVTGMQNKLYDGTKTTQNVTVELNGKVLRKDVDYTLTFKENVNAGTARMIIRGIGDYSGSLTKRYTIYQRKIGAVDIDTAGIKDVVYTGKKTSQPISIKFNGKDLVKDVDYQIIFKDNINIGTGRIIIRGLGNFSGEVKKAYRIVPKGTTITTASSKAGGFQIKWTQQPEQSDGYIIEYSDNTSFTNPQKIKLGVNYTGRTVSGLPSGKTYYVRMRVYKDVDGTRYFSPYSNTKSIVIK